MCSITIQSKNLNTEIHFKPSADFMGCLLQAVLTAMPVFLEALMKCLAGDSPETGYNPGDRQRCE